MQKGALTSSKVLSNTLTNPDSLRRAGWLTPIALLTATSAALIAILYTILPYASGYADHRISILKFARTLWDTGEDWQHCYLVPIGVFAMIYAERRRLAEIPIGSAFSGLAILIFGLFVFWVGFRADNVYVGYLSFQIVTAGLIIWLLGWTWMKALLFPWAFLAFLYPLTFLDNLVAFPLRIIMSHASVATLNILGIPSIGSGTAILSAPDAISGLKAGAQFSVDVANPCSGIRSLFALMMVSALYGYFTQRTLLKRLIIFASSIPLAVIGNLFRILMLTVGTVAFGTEFAIGKDAIDDPSAFHMFAGYLVFGVALSGMVGVGSLLNANWRALWQRLRMPPPPSQDPPSPRSPHSPGKQRPPDQY